MLGAAFVAAGVPVVILIEIPFAGIGFVAVRFFRRILFTLFDNGVFVPLLSADGALLVPDTVLGGRCGFVCYPDKAVFFSVQMLGAAFAAADVPVVILIEIPFAGIGFVTVRSFGIPVIRRKLHRALRHCEGDGFRRRILKCNTLRDPSPEDLAFRSGIGCHRYALTGSGSCKRFSGGIDSLASGNTYLIVGNCRHDVGFHYLAAFIALGVHLALNSDTRLGVGYPRAFDMLCILAVPADRAFMNVLAF